MRIVFFGTPEVAVPALDALIASPHQVVATVTQPDRARGRGRGVSASAVKRRAGDAGIAVCQPTSPKQDGFCEQLRSLQPDALAVVAYGHILPRAVLEVAPAVNAHFSLLPAYRGAAPVQRALMDGATRTGVTVFLLEPSVDSGPILRREETEIGAEEDAGSLLERLAPIGARLLVEAIDALAAGETGIPQDAGEASRAPKITPDEQRIDWSLPAETIAARIRGLSPRPGAYTSFRGKRLLVRRTAVVDGHGTPGTMLGGAVVATGERALELLEVQPEGKRVMSGDDFVRGYRPEQGTCLGS